MTTDDFSFALPPFKPDEAIVKLRRDLRQLRGLTARGDWFEYRGQPVVSLTLEPDCIRARVVERPARTPHWEDRRLASGADVRRFTEDVRRGLARWNEDE